MSEQDQLVDKRRSVVYIDAKLDDLPLTANAFRVYCHIARRAGANNQAWPSYNSIAEKCFRASYPTAKPATLRRRAIEAVKELLEFGLIVKVSRSDEERGHRSNYYALTDMDDWHPPSAYALAPPGALAPPSAYAPASALAPPSAYAPEDTPIEVTPNEVTPEGSNPKQQGGGRSSLPRGKNSGGVSGVKSTERGEGTSDGVPQEIAAQWCATFGEYTDLQAKALANLTKAEGAPFVAYALDIAASNIADGNSVKAPAKYIKSIIDNRKRQGDYGPAAQLRPGETETLEERRRYRPEPSPVVPPDDYEPDIPMGDMSWIHNPESINF